MDSKKLAADPGISIKAGCAVTGAELCLMVGEKTLQVRSGGLWLTLAQSSLSAGTGLRSQGGRTENCDPTAMGDRIYGPGDNLPEFSELDLKNARFLALGDTVLGLKCAPVKLSHTIKFQRRSA